MGVGCKEGLKRSTGKNNVGSAPRFVRCPHELEVEWKEGHLLAGSCRAGNETQGTGSVNQEEA